MGTFSSVCGCFTSYYTCSCCNSISRLCNSYSSLSCRFNAYNSFVSLYLRAIHLLCRHLITSIFKADFIISGSTGTCNFAPPLHYQQPFSCIYRTQVCYLLLLLMVLLVVMLLPFHLHILFHEQLYVFIDREVHTHLIECIPSCAFNDIFDSTLLEAIIPVLLRGKQTLVIPGDITTLMERNMLVENQNKLEG